MEANTGYRLLVDIEINDTGDGAVEPEDVTRGFEEKGTSIRDMTQLELDMFARHYAKIAAQAQRDYCSDIRKLGIPDTELLHWGKVRVTVRKLLDGNELMTATGTVYEDE